jgi:uncharacterized protein HemX
MDEKPRQRGQFGYLFWGCLVVLALAVGFVAGWRMTEHLMRGENDLIRKENAKLQSQVRQRSEYIEELYEQVQKGKRTEGVD